MSVDEITISKQDAAHRLRVSEATISRMVKRGELEGYHIAGRLRITEGSISNYIEDAKVKQAAAYA